MVEFKSTSVDVDKTPDFVFDFLSKAENYEDLMPSNVKSFETTENGAILDIQGIGKVDLAFTELKSPNYVEMKPQNKVPFEFNIQWHITGNGAKTSVHALIEAKLNFMMRMMAEKLLGDFLDVQVRKLKDKLSDA